MVKNKIGGKGHKKSKKPTDEISNKQLILKEDEQEYAKITKLLGNCHCNVLTDDGIELQCGIRGNMRKRVWINNGDFVLISLRDFQSYKGDIIHKYSDTDARTLIKSNDIKNLKIDRVDETNNEVVDDNDDYIGFDEDAENQNFSDQEINNI